MAQLFPFPSRIAGVNTDSHRRESHVNHASGITLSECAARLSNTFDIHAGIFAVR
jgi:hypothetical protein